MNLDIVLVLICFAFPSHPEECGLATLTPHTANDNTAAEVINVYCTAARRAVADQYPGSKVTRCELWEGEPLGSEST